MTALLARWTETGWWTTSGNIGLPPLARVLGVGRQQRVQHPSLRTPADGIPHLIGTLFYVKHLLSISSSQLCKVGPRLFNCFTSTLSMPAAFLFLCTAIPFRYSPSEKGNVNVTSPVTSVCCTECLGLLDLVPLPLMSIWCWNGGIIGEVLV